MIARIVQAEELSVTGETAGVTQFMDCFEPMPIIESLSTGCRGAPEVGARDQGNGLADIGAKWDFRIAGVTGRLCGQ